MYALISEFIWAFLPGPRPLEHYLCTGIDPTEYFSNSTRVFPYFRIFSILLHVVLYTRIKLFKRKVTVGPQSRGLFLKNMALADIESKSLTNCFMNVSLVSISVVTSVTMLIWSWRLKTSMDAVTFPNYIFIYFYYLIASCSLGVVMVVAYFSHNEPLRSFYSRKLKEQFQHGHQSGDCVNLEMTN